MTVYEIRVKGHLDQHRSTWFDGMMYKVCREPHVLQEYVSLVSSKLSWQGETNHVGDTHNFSRLSL
jgi:hypothetical protein